MSNPSRALRLVDPTTAPTLARFQAAPRRPLAGLRLGVMPNGKYNADHLLVAVAEQLRAQHGLADLVVCPKPSPFRPAPPALLADLRGRVDAVITGVGD